MANANYSQICPHTFTGVGLGAATTEDEVRVTSTVVVVFAGGRGNKPRFAGASASLQARVSMRTVLSPTATVELPMTTVVSQEAGVSLRSVG